MRRNVEVKARLGAGAAARTAQRLRGPASGNGDGNGNGNGQGQGQVLLQADTFFRIPRGRLKLRRTPDGRGELIFYERPDTTGPKLSRFTTTLTDDPDGLEAVLAQALGVLGVVRKRRLLFLVGQTRVHLDSVEGLGDFLELEVVLSEEQSEQDGERLAQQLLGELGVQESDLISGAYLDLLLAKGEVGAGELAGVPAPGAEVPHHPSPGL